VPVKPAGQVKSRLAKALEASMLDCLFQAMLKDVLTALIRCSEVERVVLTSSRRRSGRIAQAFDIELLEDRLNQGLNPALERVAEVLFKEGGRRLLVVHGDLPLMTSRDIRQMLAGHSQLTLVPDLAKSGTNGMVIDLPTAIPFCYGENSLVRHLKAAEKAGITARILDSPGVRLDIDEPEDLDRLAASSGASESQKLLAQINWRSSIESKATDTVQKTP